MKNPGQFGSSRPPARKAEPGKLDCAEVERLLAESAESGLPDTTMEQLRIHAEGCAACQEKLAQVRRGREWLQVLKQEALEPPAGMVAKILAQTSRAGVPGTAEITAGTEETADFAVTSGVWQPELPAEYVPAYDVEAAGGPQAAVDSRRPVDVKTGRRTGSLGSSAPAWQRNTVVVLRRTLVEPRLAMVAAMAFFSISLTLNLAGIRLTNLHPADLAPSNMRRAASRQYAEVNARMARYYENLRIVYEVEARVQQLRRAAAANPAPQREARPQKHSSNSSGDADGGEARESRRGMITNHSSRVPPVPDPAPIVSGPRMDAAWRVPGKMLRTSHMALSSPVFMKFTLSEGERLRVTKLRTRKEYFDLNLPIDFSRRFLSAPERGFA